MAHVIFYGKPGPYPDFLPFPDAARHHSGQSLSNNLFLLSVLTSWQRGQGAMPAWLGLGRTRFQFMMARHFPWLPWRTFWKDADTIPGYRKREMIEVANLIHLFANPSLPNNETRDIAWLISAGCLGQNHLYQDLGLSRRQELSAWIAWNFPALKHANHRDMKWKKFIYRQLCLKEGLHTCRAPSCSVCDDIAVCFAPEE
ncbi:MAG: nitrogen fixation protein NifQ [Magnetococcales bacterium]|nr:nitrogen fixation protein NifQ [Magnetococcales bacterium]